MSKAQFILFVDLSYTLLVVLSSESMRVLKRHKVYLEGDSQTLPRWHLPPDELLNFQEYADSAASFLYRSV